MAFVVGKMSVFDGKRFFRNQITSLNSQTFGLQFPILREFENIDF